MTERGEILWSPAEDAWETTALGRFAAERGFGDYESLHAWSVSDLDGFWTAANAFTGLRWRTPPARALDGARMPGVTWFPGGELNYAEHALAAAPDRPGDVAVIGHSQTRARVQLTWAELDGQVRSVAAALLELGVRRGDRVAAYAPNIPETLVAFLATASIGAVWSSCATEFGVKAVTDRFAQIEPVVLLTVSGYRYGAKHIDRRAEVAAVAAALPSVRHVVEIGYGDLPGLGIPAVPFGDLLAVEPIADPAWPVAVPADHPLYILFSSGTTGLPKAIVHGHGGITAEHLKVHVLHNDLGPDSRMFWFSTTGWMMWNYLVSALLAGSSVVLFDGDPGSPDLGALWTMAAEEDVTYFGTSAPYLMACRRAGVQPARGSLEWVGSTAAPLPAAGFRWVAEALGVPVSSISGGTDICSAFVGGSPVLPVRAGEISGSFLGAAVEAWDPSGARCPAGETGEFVVTAPLPSMPVALWGDADGSAMRKAYFADYPGVWRHGDWLTAYDDGACVISGRSDATLNRGGVRLGTSDFYAVVESVPGVGDSLVVHLEDTSGEGGLGELILFVALAGSSKKDRAPVDSVIPGIRAALRGELSPRHVPDAIVVAPSVPRTLSGKKLEVPVKRILLGADPETAAAKDSLADPESLAWYVAEAARRAGRVG